MRLVFHQLPTSRTNSPYRDPWAYNESPDMDNNDDETLPPNRPIRLLRSSHENRFANGTLGVHEHIHPLPRQQTSIQSRRTYNDAPPIESIHEHARQRNLTRTLSDVPASDGLEEEQESIQITPRQQERRRFSPQSRFYRSVQELESRPHINTPTPQVLTQSQIEEEEENAEEDARRPTPIPTAILPRAQTLFSRTRNLFSRNRNADEDETPQAYRFPSYSRDIQCVHRTYDLGVLESSRRHFPGERFAGIQLGADGWERTPRSRLRHRYQQLPRHEILEEVVVQEEEQGVDDEEGEDEWEDDWQTEIFDDFDSSESEDIDAIDVPEYEDEDLPPTYAESEFDSPVQQRQGQIQSDIVLINQPNLILMEMPPPTYEAIAWDGKKRCGYCCRTWGKIKNWFRVRKDVVERHREVAF